MGQNAFSANGGSRRRISACSAITTVSRMRAASASGCFATRRPMRADAGGCMVWGRHELRRTPGHNTFFISEGCLQSRRAVVQVVIALIVTPDGFPLAYEV